jgi:hypothetical protein
VRVALDNEQSSNQLSQRALITLIASPGYYSVPDLYLHVTGRTFYWGTGGKFILDDDSL